MSKFKLRCGDNIELLKKLPDNSIDAIVSDPPYALNFMNKKWDSDVPSVEFWKEVWRVLKPGGHVLSFGGTRTYHRMVVNIEDAGFEIRDQIMWLYGCLDDKSEILTDSGWKKYHDITLNDKALSWNSENDKLEFNKIDDIIIKPYKGDMVLLKNKHTYQVLTPNHRVYHKYERKDRGYLGENWEVVEAGDMKKSGSYTLPLASYYEGEGIGGEDYAALLGWIWSEGEFDKKGNAIRISQSSINQPLVDEIKELIERLNIKYSHYSRERFYNYKNKGLQSYIDNCFYFSTENDINDKIRTDLTNKKLNFDFIKKMTIREKIAFLDTAHKGDGSKGRETIYQNDLSQLELLQFMLFTIGKSSYFDLNKMAINFRNKETTELQHKNLNKKVHYEGDVWCVRVKNSAFVARRGDKVFITGNSGFPKSHNIGKAVDKLQGNKREIVGEKEQTGAKFKSWSDDPEQTRWHNQGFNKLDGKTFGITKGQSKYEGWGTALKPANEPICLARKPLSEKSVAENVLKWGTGGINIDGCRVGSEVCEAHEGRFPVNIILECICDEVIKGEKFDRKPRPKVNDHNENSIFGIGGVGVENYDYNDKGDIHTNPMCPCRLMDEQSGVSKSNPDNRKEKKATGEMFGTGKITSHNDKGGASRFFYQAKVSKKERNMGLDGFEIKINIGTIKLLIYKRKNEILWERQDLNQTHQVDMEQLHQKDIEEYTTKEECVWNTELFGNYIMEKFQKDIKSIIKMKTNSITIYQTLNSLIQQSTNEYIVTQQKELMDGIKFVESADKKSTKAIITYQKKDGLNQNVNPVSSQEVWNISVRENKNIHSTVKPVQLMAYLCRLVTPPGGTILDPFVGSGSTGIAALLEGFNFIGFDLDPDYFKIAEARITNYEKYREFLKNK